MADPQPSSETILRDAATSLRTLLDSVLTQSSLSEAFVAVAEATVATLRAGGTVFICGNGGSAAQATHLAGEFLGPFYDRQRPAFRAVPLGFDPASLTAVANDFSYEIAFARQLQGLGRVGDMVWGLTTSGNSPNIVATMERARQMEITTVLFAAGDGGRCAALADHMLLVPKQPTPRVQEIHLLLGHCICEHVENALKSV